MAKSVTLNVSLTVRHRKLIDSELKAGRVASASEVVREGLRLYERERRRDATLEWLRDEIAIGVAEADRGEFLDADAVFAELREHSARLPRQAMAPHLD
jgi:antitoxin ParD1/3/4